ncbi:asparaginase [Alkalilacustris brevis]|uniref:asparaginase n=1 Tax=Alkalilacustris brevis TaxID=2026338 RepID=UPI000E0CE4F2|nr:asparaginase [Alkalilacustris brevis]
MQQQDRAPDQAADRQPGGRVAVLALGGTIAMTRDASGGIAPSLSGADLVAAVPGLGEVADVTVASPFQMPGASLGITHLIRVAAEIEAALAAGAAGAVVVQGTDTIEETAFVLDCLLQVGAPVVVTGAMRGAQAAGADGPANLLASVSVAASGARDTGVLVVLGDEVHAARFVRKGHTGRPHAFTSAPFGPVGHVVEGRFQQQLRLPARPVFSLPPDAVPPPVALVQIGLGDDGRMLPALPDLGYRGAVIAAMGAGHVPQPVAGPLEALAAQMPVVLSTRVAEGPVFERTYGFEGSEIDLLRRGLVHGGGLGALKARLLLQLALADGTASGEDLARIFRHYA